MKGQIGAIILGVFILLAAAVIAMPSLAQQSWDFGIWLLTAMFWLFIIILIIVGIIAFVVLIIWLKMA
jgi:hypothetical protein